MKFQSNRFAKLMALAAVTATASLHANVVWPAMIVGGAIWSTWFVIIISVIVEAYILKRFIPALSNAKALIVSLVGNAVAALIGTIITGIAMLGWHYVFDMLLGGTFSPVNKLVTMAVMFIGSCLIEYAAIRLIFGYRSKQLWLAILVGNLITYLLVILLNSAQFVL